MSQDGGLHAALHVKQPCVAARNIHLCIHVRALGTGYSCNFGPFLKDMWQDHLIVGVNDDQIERWLLAEGDLLLERVMELALGALNLHAIKGVCHQVA